MSSLRSSLHHWSALYRELSGSWSKSAGSTAELEDAIQTSVTAYLAVDASGILSERAYLHRSVRNALADAYRQRQVLNAVSIDELDEHDHPVADDPEGELRVAELIAALKVALAELPPKCQQVFLWHRLEGYTQPEIAQRMGLSLNMVERYMIRATRHLRERLQDYRP